MSNTTTSNNVATSGSVRMIINILILILGIIFIANPGAALQGITITLGILLIVYGGVMIAVHELKRGKGETPPPLGWPIVWMVVGVLLLVFEQQAARWLLPLVIGVWMILVGIINLRNSHEIRKMGGKSHTFALITAVAELVLGILSLVSMAYGGEALGVMMGICMLIYGVASIISWAVNYVAFRNS